MDRLSQHKAIVFYDGVCTFCSTTIKFIIDKDRHDYFRFSTLTSEFGKTTLKRFNINSDSIVLLENNTVYTQSDAILHILKHLHGWYSLLYFGILVPKIIRNFFYKTIAKNRYRILGKRDKCLLPTNDLIKKFI